MTMKTLLGAAALALTTVAPVANAATFDFNWSADPALDANIQSSIDPTLTAVGTFDIDAPFGSSFSGVSNVNIVISGSGISDTTATLDFGTTGSVSLAGEVSFTDVWFATGGPISFGCFNFLCEDTLVGILHTDPSLFNNPVSYTSQQTALQSLNAATSAVSAVPLPAGSFLLFTGLAGVAGLKRRKKRTA